MNDFLVLHNVRGTKYTYEKRDGLLFCQAILFDNRIFSGTGQDTQEAKLNATKQAWYDGLENGKYTASILEEPNMDQLMRVDLSKLNIKVTKLPSVCNEWMNKHVLTGKKIVLGFDTESLTIKSRENQLSVLQFSVGYDVLILGTTYKSVLPPTILEVFASKDIYKCALNIEGDFKTIRKTYGDDFETKQTHDIGEMASEYGYNAYSSLHILASRLLHLDVDKDETLYDWGRWPLTQDQIAYAAMDACISREIGVQLFKRKSPKKKYLTTFNLMCECDKAPCPKCGRGALSNGPPELASDDDEDDDGNHHFS